MKHTLKLMVAGSLLAPSLVMAAHAAKPAPQSHIQLSGELALLAQDNSSYILANTNPGIRPIYLSDVFPTPETEKRINTGHKLAGGGSIGYLTPDLTDFTFSVFVNDNREKSTVDTNPIPEFESFGDEPEDTANGTAHFSTYSFSLTVGHLFKPRSNFSVHPYAGLNVSNIKDSLSIINQEQLPFDRLSTQSQQRNLQDEQEPIFTSSIKASSSFTGIGPVLGVDTDYRFTKHFSLNAGASLGLLVGSIKSTHSIKIADDSAFVTSSKTKHSLVEQLSANLGLGYHFTISKHPAAVTAGYRYTTYIHSSNTPDILNPESTGDALFDDHGFSGPFIRLGLTL